MGLKSVKKEKSTCRSTAAKGNLEMGSEALRNLKTMRQVKSSLDVARKQKTRTTNSLSKTKEELEQLETVNSRQTEQVLSKEKIRFAAYEASVEKSRQRLLKSRAKLATMINNNRALGEMRYQLQKSRWQNPDTILPAAPAVRVGTSGRERLHQIELEY
jgi:hypothetical protein